jgi:hypothetical protein
MSNDHPPQQKAPAGTTARAFEDLREALAEFWAELGKPFVRLLDWLADRRRFL